jgi:fucose 4-O-acetylase-like acetyltransferase
MLRKLFALAVALVVPYFIFLFVISLNESNSSQKMLQDKVLNFDVEKKKADKET